MEVLVLNDNSKDWTQKVLENFAKKDKRIKIFNNNKKNLWPYWWLNYLLDRSKWKYVALQEHDDIWHKDKIKKQIDFLEKNNDFVACSTAYMQYFTNNDVWRIIDVPDWPLWTAHPSLVRRNIKNIRYDKLEFMWDTYFINFVLPKFWKIRNFSDVFFISTRKSNNLSDWRFIFSILNIRRFFFIQTKVHKIPIFKVFIYILWLFLFKRFFGKYFPKKITWINWSKLVKKYPFLDPLRKKYVVL
jgi:hypothetical protein